jgi:hypothetical protein
MRDHTSLASKVPDTAADSADPATEMADQATEVADPAAEVANPAREAADWAKERTTCLSWSTGKRSRQKTLLSSLASAVTES